SARARIRSPAVFGQGLDPGRAPRDRARGAGGAAAARRGPVGGAARGPATQARRPPSPAQAKDGPDLLSPSPGPGAGGLRREPLLRTRAGTCAGDVPARAPGTRYPATLAEAARARLERLDASAQEVLLPAATLAAPTL